MAKFRENRDFWSGSRGVEREEPQITKTVDYLATVLDEEQFQAIRKAVIEKF